MLKTFRIRIHPSQHRRHKMAVIGLSWVDYFVFGLVLFISWGIGIFYGIKQRKSSTTEILLGGRSMTILPVTLSLTASFMSAIALLGTPAEIYIFSTIWLWSIFGYIIAIPIAAHVYVPVFYNLQITSIFEYVQIRFGTALRLSNVFLYIFQMVVYMGIALYAPSLALQAVTGLNVWFSVLLVGGVCTFYTTLGGMKAVLWTDAFQIFIMLTGLVAVLYQGEKDFDGFEKIWEYLKEGKRVVWSNFDPDPTVRHTIWGIFFGGTFLWLPVYAANQAQIQRALSLPTLRKAQIAYWVSLPIIIVLILICGVCGMVCYAEFRNCDPLSNGDISSKDQILPYYVMLKLAYLKGIPGLFIASIFSGTLSSISTVLNALSAVTLEDLIKPYCCPKMSESRASLVTKLLAFIYGVVCIAMSYVASQLGGVLQAAVSLFGMIGGPQLGIFTLGIVFPFVNHIGALIGLYSGLIFTLWIGLGAQAYKRFLVSHPAPMSIEGCLVQNATLWNTTTPFTSGEFSSASPWTTPVPEVEDRSGFLSLYTVSYLWYGVIAWGSVVLVGVIASLIVNCFSSKKKPVDPRLHYPLLASVVPCFPKKAKLCLSCNVDYDQETGHDDKLGKTDLWTTSGKSENGLSNDAFQSEYEKDNENSVEMRNGDKNPAQEHTTSQMSHM